MPRPAYIVCASVATVDRETSSLSFTNVIETISPIPEDGNQPQGSVPVSQHYVGARLIATWAREDGDDIEQRYECRVSGVRPDGGSLFESPWIPVRFQQDTYHYRVVVNLPNFGTFAQDGLYLLRAVLRREGVERIEGSQEFPFRVMHATTQEKETETLPTDRPST